MLWRTETARPQALPAAELQLEGVGSLFYINVMLAEVAARSDMSPGVPVLFHIAQYCAIAVLNIVNRCPRCRPSAKVHLPATVVVP